MIKPSIKNYIKSKKTLNELTESEGNMKSKIKFARINSNRSSLLSNKFDKKKFKT